MALAFALAPAAGCAHWFTVRGRRVLAASRGLGELAARVRPLLLVVTLLFLGALGVLLLSAAAVLGGGDPLALGAAAALGVLLFLARLLAVHGFPGAAAAGLASAAALEALAPALVLIARLPGVPPVDAPVAALATTVGPAAVPAVACTAAALGLLAHGLRALTGACAHWPAPPDRRRRTGRDPPDDHRPPIPGTPTRAPPPRTAPGAAPRNGRSGHRTADRTPHVAPALRADADPAAEADLLPSIRLRSTTYERPADHTPRGPGVAR